MMFLAKVIHGVFIILQIACIKAGFNGESLLNCGWNNPYSYVVGKRKNTISILNKIRIDALAFNCIRRPFE